LLLLLLLLLLIGVVFANLFGFLAAEHS